MAVARARMPGPEVAEGEVAEDAEDVEDAVRHPQSRPREIRTVQ